MAAFSAHALWRAGHLIFIPGKDPADVRDASVLLHKCCVRWWDNQAGYADQARWTRSHPPSLWDWPALRRWSRASACPCPCCLQNVLLLLCAGEGLITVVLRLCSVCFLIKKTKHPLPPPPKKPNHYRKLMSSPQQSHHNACHQGTSSLVAWVRRQRVEQDGGT